MCFLFECLKIEIVNTETFGAVVTISTSYPGDLGFESGIMSESLVVSRIQQCYDSTSADSVMFLKLGLFNM
jgi:hypothetical protein